MICNTCCTISNQRIGFICGLWTLSRQISVKFVIFPDFTPFMRPFRPQKGLIKGPKMEKSIESSRTTSFPHFKLVWMISLGSVGPWAAYFNEISYIFVIFGPDIGPTGPAFLKFDRNRSRGYRECLTFSGTYSEYLLTQFLTDMYCLWVSIRANYDYFKAKSADFKVVGPARRIFGGPIRLGWKGWL